MYICIYILPPLSLAFFLAVFLSLVRRDFLSFSTPGSHDFNLKQSFSHCKYIFHSPARGFFSQMERRRRRIEGETNW